MAEPQAHLERALDSVATEQVLADWKAGIFGRPTPTDCLSAEDPSACGLTCTFESKRLSCRRDDCPVGSGRDLIELLAPVLGLTPERTTLQILERYAPREAAVALAALLEESLAAGDRSRAFQLLEMLVRVDPGDLDNRRRLAELRFESRDAIRYAREAESLVRELEAVGRNEDAAAEARALAERLGTNCFARRFLAQHYDQTGRSRDSAEQLIAVVSILADGEMFDEALEVAEQLRQQAERMPELLPQIAACLQRLGQLHSASQAWQRSTRHRLAAGEAEPAAESLLAAADCGGLEPALVQEVAAVLQESGAQALLRRIAEHPGIPSALRAPIAGWLADQAPDDAEAAVFCGLVREEAGDFEGAVDTYRRAARLHGAFAAAGDARVAVLGWERTSRDATADLELQERLARVHATGGNPAVAERSLQAVVAGSSEATPDRLLELAAILPDSMAVRVAVADRLAALPAPLPPAACDQILQTAEQHGFLGDWEEADSLLCRVLEKMPNNLAARRLRAEARDFLGDAAGAREDNLAASDLAFSSGDHRLARELLQQAASRGALSPRQALLLTRLYVEGGEREAALETIRQLIGSLKSNAEASVLVEAGTWLARLAALEDLREVIIRVRRTYRDKWPALHLLGMLEEHDVDMVFATVGDERFVPSGTTDYLVELTMKYPDRHEPVLIAVHALEKTAQAAHAEQVLAAAMERARDAPDETRLPILHAWLDRHPQDQGALEELITALELSDDIDALARAQARWVALYADTYGKPPEFLHHALRLVEEMPGNQYLRLAIPDALERLGDRDAACRVLRQWSHDLQAAGRLDTARQMLEKALTIDADDAPAREHLARLLLLQGRREDSAAQWRHLLRFLRDIQELHAARNAALELAALEPDNPSVLAKLVDVTRECGAPDADLLDAMHRLAAACRAAGQGERHRQVLEEILALDPTDTRALEQLLLHARDSGTPPSSELAARLVRALLDQQRPEEAAGQGLTMLEGGPPCVELLSAVMEALLQLQRGDEYIRHAEALARLQESQHPGTGQTLLQESASALLDRKLFAPALQLIANTGDLHQGDMYFHRIRALALEGVGCEPEAAAAWSDLATLQRETQLPADAEVSIRRAIALRPRDVAIRHQLIGLLLEMGNAPAAIAAEALDLVQLLEHSAQLPEAIAVLRDALSHDPENLELLRRRSALETQCGLNADAAESLVRLGTTASSYGRTDLALPALLQAAELQPTEARPLELLLEFAEQQEDAELRREISLRLADLLAGKDEPARAIAVLERLPREDSGPVAIRLARLYALSGRNAQAASILRSIIDDTSDPGTRSTLLNEWAGVDQQDPEPLVRLAQLHASRNDRTQAARQYRAAAQRAIDKQDNAFATKLLEDVQQLLPGDVESLRLKADILASEGKGTMASREYIRVADLFHASVEEEHELEALRKAVALEPHNIPLLLRCAGLLAAAGQPAEAASHYLAASRQQQSTGDFAEAVRTAREAARLSPLDPEPRTRLADLLEAEGRADEAVEVLLWLTDYFAERDEPMRALSRLEWAMNLRPSAAGYLKAGDLAILACDKARAVLNFELAANELEKEGRPAEYRDAMERALRLQPAHRSLLRRYVQLWRSSNDAATPTRFLLETLDSLVQRGEIDDSRAVLEIGTGALEDPEPFLRGAATIMLDNGVPELAAAQLAHAAHLLLHRGRLDDAAEAVEKAIEMRPADPHIQAIRLDVLLAQQREPEAVRHGDTLIVRHQERGETAEAVGLCLRLKEAFPGNPLPRERLVLLYQEAREKHAHLEELEGLDRLYASREDEENRLITLRRISDLRPLVEQELVHLLKLLADVDSPEEYLARGRELAAIYDRTGRTALASALYEDLASRNPGDLSLRQQRLANALRDGTDETLLRQVVELVSLYRRADRIKEAKALVSQFEGMCSERADFHEEAAQLALLEDSRGQASRSLWRAVGILAGPESARHRVRVLKQLIDVDPLDIQPHRLLVEALLDCGESKDAAMALILLAQAYHERGHDDFAASELEKAVEIDPTLAPAWEMRFTILRNRKRVEELTEAYCDFADALVDVGDFRTAIEFYLRAVENTPRSLRAHRGYITQYPRIGDQREILEEILAFGQMLVEAGEVDAGMGYFELIMSIDPKNPVVRDMLSATRGKHSSSAVKLPVADPSDSEIDLSATQVRLLQESSTARELLAGELTSLEQQESREALEQVVQSYRDTLAINPGNAAIRVKLADLLEQMGRIPEMLEQLGLASEIYQKKDELAQCVAACERYLRMNPGDQRMRKRMNEAILKRDAFKALESAIIFSDADEDERQSRQIRKQ